MGAELDAADRELCLAELDEVHLGGKRLEGHGKVRVVHRSGDRRREPAVHPGGPIDRDVAAGSERGEEERETLDVVRVRVGEQQMEPHRSFAREREPELPRAGAAVEHEERAVVGRDLDAGRVTAVAKRLGAGGGDRAARSPEPDADVSVPPEPGR